MFVPSIQARMYKSQIKRPFPVFELQVDIKY